MMMTTRRLLVLFESVRATRATTPRFRSSCRARLESGHARTRAVSNNARRQRSIDRSMDDVVSTQNDDDERATKRHGSYLREFLDGVSRGVPRVPRHERVARESSPNVLARSNASRASESDRRRGVPPFLHQRRRLFCVWLNFGWWGWWWCLSSFLPFFITTFSKRTKKNKQTNKQIKTNEERNKHTKVLKIRTKYSRVAYVLVCVTNNI